MFVWRYGFPEEYSTTVGPLSEDRLESALVDSCFDQLGLLKDDMMEDL